MKQFLNNTKRGESPLFCSSRLTLSDIKSVKQQMEKRNFSSDIMVSTARRCSWGLPQVIICRPMFRLKPFPTTFWLTCPWLVKKCGELESQGKVRSLEVFMSNRRSEWIEYNSLLKLFRLSLLSFGERHFLRNYKRPQWESLQRTLIGGIRASVYPTMKCLHLQVGTWLALGFHPGEQWLDEHFPLVSCDNPCKFPCGFCSKPSGRKMN